MQVFKVHGIVNADVCGNLFCILILINITLRALCLTNLIRKKFF